MKTLYLVLAIIGAVIPYVFFIQHFSSDGLSLVGFVRALFANPAASGFTADLLLTSAIFWVFMFQQRSRGKGPWPGNLHLAQSTHWTILRIPGIPLCKGASGNDSIGSAFTPPWGRRPQSLLRRMNFPEQALRVDLGGGGT